MSQDTSTNQPEKKADPEITQKSGLQSDVMGLLGDEYKKFSQQKNLLSGVKYEDEQGLINDFFEYVKKEHGNQWLSSINADKRTIFFSMIKGLGLKPSTFQKKGNQLSSRLDTTGKTEKDAINKALEEIKKIDPDKAKEFGLHCGLGTELTIKDYDKTAKVKSLGMLKKMWRDYPKRSDWSLEQQKQCDDLLGEVTYNQTEKMLVVASLKKMRDDIQNNKLKEAFDDKFKRPLTAISPVNNLNDFAQMRKEFLTENKQLIDEQQSKIFNNTIVYNNDVLDACEWYAGASSAEMSVIKNDKMADRSKDFKLMFDSLTAEQFMQEFMQQKTTVEQHAQNAGDVFQTVPPSFNVLFDASHGGFPSDMTSLEKFDPTLSSKVQAYEKQIDTLQQTMSQENMKNQTKEFGKKIEAIVALIEWEKRKAFLAQIKAKDPQLGNVLQTAYEYHFNLAKLSKSDQQLITDRLVAISMDKLKSQDTIPALFGMDKEKYHSFVKELFDLNKMDIDIPYGPNGSVHLHFTDKSFLANGIDPTQFRLDNMKGRKHLGLNFTIDVTAENEAFIHAIYGGSNKSTMFNRFNSANATLIHSGYQVTVEKDGKRYAGFLAIDGSGIKEIEKDKSELPGWILYTHAPNQFQLNRKIVTDETGKAIHIPFDQESQRNITVNQKQLHLNGNTIGGLLLGYAIGDSVGKTQDMNKASPQDVNERIKEMVKKGKNEESDDKTLFNDPYKDTIEQQKLHDADIKHHLEQSDKERDKKNEEYLEADARNQIQPRNREDIKAEVGTSLWVQEGESRVPPFTDHEMGPGGYWHQYEITKKEGGKIQFTLHGGDEKHQNEGEVLELDDGPELWHKFREVYGSGNIYKVPPATNTGQFTNQMTHLIDAGVPDVSEHLESINTLSLQDGGFKTSRDGQEEDVHRFCIEGKSPNNKPEIVKCIVTPLGNGRLKIVSDNWVKREKSGAINHKVTYEQEMDYAGFLLFLGESKMTPRTKAQVDAFEARQKDEYGVTKHGDLSHKKWDIWSINNFIGFGKERRTGMQDKRKEYNKERVDELTDLIATDWKLYERMSNAFPFRGGWSSAWSKMDYDTRTNKGPKIYAKITAWRDMYAKEADATPVATEIRKMLLKGPYPMLKKKYQVAGAMLFMMEKAGGLYARGMASEAGTGLRVRALLGDAHHDKFIIKLKDLEARAKADPYNEDLRRQISNCEALYVNEAVDGLDEVIKYRYGVEFADHVMESYSAAYGEEKINGIAKGYESQGQFGHKFHIKFMGDLAKMSVAKCLGALKACATLAKKPYEVEKVKMGILMVMLSGMNLFAGDEHSLKFLAKFSRKIGFLPGMMIEDYNHQGKVQRLLDIVSKGTFSEEVEYNTSKFSASTYGKKGMYGGENTYDKGGPEFPGKFMKWRNKVEDASTRGKKVLDFIDLKNITDKENNIFATKINGQEVKDEERVLLDEFIKLSLTRSEEIDSGTIRQYFYDNPWTVPKAVLSNNFLRKINEGSFIGTEEEIESAELFRRSLAKQIPTSTMTDDPLGSKVAFITKKFFTFFEGIITGPKRETFAQILGVIKKETLLSSHSKDKSKEIKFLIQNAIQGPMRERTYPQAIYNTMEKFEQFFINNIDSINGDLIEDAMEGEEYKRAFNSPGRYIPGYGDLEEREISQFEGQRRKDKEYAINPDEELLNKKIANINRGLKFRGNDIKYPAILRQGGAGEKSSDHSKNTSGPSTRSNAIAATNANILDVVGKGGKSEGKQGGGQQSGQGIRKQTSPKHMTRDQLTRNFDDDEDNPYLYSRARGREEDAPSPSPSPSPSPPPPPPPPPPPSQPS